MGRGSLFTTVVLVLVCATQANAAVLHTQYDNAAANNIASHDYVVDAQDSEAADDFIVPAGQTWDLTSIEVDGANNFAGEQVGRFVVRFYDNGAGNLPGTLRGSDGRIASISSGTVTVGPNPGDFTIGLASPAPVRLGAGTYWISVQGTDNTTAMADRWAWQNRTVQFNNGAAWRNPGNGYGLNCPTFTRRTTCQTDSGPDQVFRLNGSVVTHSLSVSRSGQGAGTVTSSPGGISCGADCSHTYNHNTSVVLTATPDANSTFASWTGCDSPSGITCTLTMNTNKVVTANFDPAQRTLTVAKAGAGSGTITSTPLGIDCGVDCSHAYDHGTSVTLTATPGAGSAFASWSNCDSPSGSTCTMSATTDKTVTATFGTVPPLETTITDVTIRKLAARARFAFEGSGGVGLLSFECRLDRRPFRSCASPKRYRNLAGGRHTFKVRTKDAGGAVDATPAKVRFRIPQ